MLEGVLGQQHHIVAPASMVCLHHLYTIVSHERALLCGCWLESAHCWRTALGIRCLGFQVLALQGALPSEDVGELQREMAMLARCVEQYKSCQQAQMRAEVPVSCHLSLPSKADRELQTGTDLFTKLVEDQQKSLEQRRRSRDLRLTQGAAHFED